MLKSTKIILKKVVELGGKTREISCDRGVHEIEYKNKSFIITEKFKVNKNSVGYGKLTKFKDVTAFLLTEAGINNPQTVVVNEDDDLSKMKKEISRLKYPIVVKDNEGTCSRGVFVDIATSKEAVEVLGREISKYGAMLAQEMIFGKEYRMLVLDGRIIGGMEMIPPFIIGDGAKTVAELMKEKQKNSKMRTKLTKALEKTLAQQQEAFSSVPKKGKQVFIRKKSSLAEGGSVVDVTEKIHPSFSELLTRASSAVNLSLAGIDIICQDATKDINLQAYSILEINGKPDLYIHYPPFVKNKIDVVKEIMDFIVEKKLS